jgi:integrase
VLQRPCLAFVQLRLGRHGDAIGDGRIPANPAEDVRRPKAQGRNGQGMVLPELGAFLVTAERSDRNHAAFAVLISLNALRVPEACGTNIEDLDFQRGHPTLASQGQQAAHHPARASGSPYHRPGRRPTPPRPDPPPP